MAAAHREPDLEALLRESAWVRGLARGLVGEGAAADDLAQDVLVAALDRRPGLEGLRLRSWLRTVARRLALRSRERHGLREHAERTSPPRDDTDRSAERDADRRVELQRELTAALGELQPADRAALVLRYFDGLSTRELARHLGLEEAAARKRLSRALERLRERLDARAGGQRRVWSAALLAAMGPRVTEAPQPALPVTTLLAGLMTKTISTVVALGAVSLWLALSRPWIAQPTAAPEVIVAVAPQLDEARVTVDTSTIGATSLAQSERLALDVAPADTTPLAARVRVVDALGAGVAGARVAWIDAAGRVSALELGADGSAPRPGDSAGARFFALAECHGFGFARAGSHAAEVVLVLSATRTLTGRVLEDGEPPRAPLRLRHQPHSSLPGVSASEFGADDVRRALDVLPEGRVVLTEPDGTFHLSGVSAGEAAYLRLPATHRILSVDGRPQAGAPESVQIAADVTEVLLETARLPSVVGRLVWEDDGEPLHGHLMVVFRTRRAVSDMTTSAWLDEQGHFSIGVPIEPRALLGPFESRGAALTERSLRIRPDGRDIHALPFEHTVDLSDVVFPLDVGTVCVPRAPVLHLRLVGPDGAPIVGAAVASDLARASSDADGRVRIAVGHGPVRVLALDCALSELATPQEHSSAGSPLELRLAPGATLEVIAPRAEGASPWAGRSVRLSWSETPFEGANTDAPGHSEPMPTGLYRQLFGWGWKDLGYGHGPRRPGQVSVVFPVRGPLLVPGWRLGAKARLELLDAVEQPLAQVELHVPDAPGRFTADLTDLVPDTGRLRLRLVDSEGRSFPRASFVVHAPGNERQPEFVHVDGSSLDLGPLALGEYDVTAQVDGYLSRGLEGVRATADAPEQTLVLSPSRSLVVALVDEAGQAVRVNALELRGATRRWAPSTWNEEELVGSATFHDLPLTPLELSVVIGTRTWTRAVDAEQASLSLVLPVHGQLALSVHARELLTGKHGRVAVRLRELDGEGTLEEKVSVSRGGVGPSVATLDLLPGRYELSVDLQEHPEGALDTDAPITRSLARREVEVRARERSDIEVAP